MTFDLPISARRVILAAMFFVFLSGFACGAWVGKFLYQ